MPPAMEQMRCESLWFPLLSCSVISCTTTGVLDLALQCGSSSDASSPLLMRAAAFHLQNMTRHDTKTLDYLRPRIDPFLRALYQLTASEFYPPLALVSCHLIHTLTRDHQSYFSRLVERR